MMTDGVQKMCRASGAARNVPRVICRGTLRAAHQGEKFGKRANMHHQFMALTGYKDADRWGTKMCRAWSAAALFVSRGTSWRKLKGVANMLQNDWRCRSTRMIHGNSATHHVPRVTCSGTFSAVY